MTKNRPIGLPQARTELVEWIEKTLQIEGQMATAGELIEVGNSFVDRGQLAEGINRYRQALLIDPGHAEAHNNLGIALYSQGEHAAAINAFRDALRANPNYANAYNNLGNALKGQGQSHEVIECYRQALRLNPHHANAHNNFGLALLAQGQSAEAAHCFRQAIALSPNYANAHNNLGQALKAQGQVAEEEACYRRALSIDLGHTGAHYNLGACLQGQNRLAEAEQAYRQALRLDPGNAAAHNGLGTILNNRGELDNAEASYRHALQVDPNLADVHANLGTVFIWRGELARAQESYGRALDIDPANKNARFSRSMLRLLHGDFEGGWPDYELRATQLKTPPRALKEPCWDGSPLGGKVILIHAEQGFGDTIHFMRYLPLVKQRGGYVVFECQKELLPLLEEIPGVDQLLARGETLPSFDVHAPLLTLPALFRTTLDSIPADIPYLFARTDLVAFWRKELATLGGFKVGIAWQGSADNPGDRYRSFSPAHFEKLARVQGVRLVSLQKGPGAAQLVSLGESLPVVQFDERLDAHAAFLDTAAIMKNLDLVVTADTAVAHLAGALGVPVWVVLSFVPDWRWLLGRADSPWYPTTRLFRQSRVGDWDEVFGRVASELGHRISSAS